MVAATSLSCNEMWFAGLLSRGNLLCHRLPYDDLLFGDVLPFDADPLPEGDDLAFRDVPFPHDNAFEALVCTSREVAAVSSAF